MNLLNNTERFRNNAIKMLKKLAGEVNQMVPGLEEINNITRTVLDNQQNCKRVGPVPTAEVCEPDNNNNNLHGPHR